MTYNSLMSKKSHKRLGQTHWGVWPNLYPGCQLVPCRDWHGQQLAQRPQRRESPDYAGRESGTGGTQAGETETRTTQVGIPGHCLGFFASLGGQNDRSMPDSIGPSRKATL